MSGILLVKENVLLFSSCLRECLLSLSKRMSRILLVREIGWRINLDAIHSAFKEEIAVFPDMAGSVCEVRADEL